MDDERIIELFFARSENAITELAGKYGGACFRLAYNILNDRQDAEECVNDAYLGVWNAIPPAHPDPLMTYVLKVVRNVSLGALNRKRAKKRNGGMTAVLEEMEPFLPGRSYTDEEVAVRELTRLIEEFLSLQKPENRIMFIRRYWFADGIGDIAKRMGMSEKNVTVRLVRMRQRLKAFLERSDFL